MYFRRIKFWNSFLVLLLLYFLGYTHFLGGPYWLARFLFILMLLGALFLLLFIWGIVRFLKRIFRRQTNNPDNPSLGESETIKVDAEIIE